MRVPSLRWAAVGGSEVAARQVIPAIRSVGDVVVVAMSHAQQHARRFAAANQVAAWSTDLDSVLDRPDVDAVYISSNSERHYTQTMAALAAGKHVLCEKPMALGLDEAERIIEAATRAGVVYAVNHHLPGAATHRAIRRLVAEGAIGKPLAVSVSHVALLPSRLRGWRLAATQGAGVVMDMTPHDASVVNSVLGVPATVATGVGVHQGPWHSGEPDAVMFSLAYGNVTVQAHNAYTVRYRRSRFDVFGTEGAILGEDVMFPDPHGTVVLRTAAGERAVYCGERRNVYEIVVDGFRQAIAGTGAPTVTGPAAANALAVALAVRTAIAQRRSVEIDRWFTDGMVR